MTGRWKKLDSYAELMEWAASRLCKTKEAFEAMEGQQLLVLDVFESKRVQETNQRSFGMELSCKHLLYNFWLAVDGGDAVSLSYDGTYRLTDAGWTLINIGVVGVIYDVEEAQHRQRFVPCANGFVCTECELSYGGKFASVRSSVREFLGFELTPAVGSIDCAPNIATSLQKAWPGITIITCWARVSRNCLSSCKKNLFSDMTFLAVVKDDINAIHKSTTYKHFKTLSKALVQKWGARHETKYADWFETTYLTKPFDSWYVGASKVPGLLPQQQSIESYHKNIKAHMGLYLRAAMVYFLEYSIVKIITYSCAHRIPEEIRTFDEAPLLHQQLAKALNIVQDRSKFYVESSPRFQNVYICRSKSFNQTVSAIITQRYWAHANGIITHWITAIM